MGFCATLGEGLATGLVGTTESAILPDFAGLFTFLSGTALRVVLTAFTTGTAFLTAEDFTSLALDFAEFFAVLTAFFTAAFTLDTTVLAAFLAVAFGAGFAVAFTAGLLADLAEGLAGLFLVTTTGAAFLGAGFLASVFFAAGFAAAGLVAGFAAPFTVDLAAGFTAGLDDPLAR